MTTIAVIGATGTVGSRVAAHLECRDITVVKITRSHGVDRAPSPAHKRYGFPI